MQGVGATAESDLSEEQLPLPQLKTSKDLFAFEFKDNRDRHCFHWLI